MANPPVPSSYFTPGTAMSKHRQGDQSTTLHQRKLHTENYENRGGSEENFHHSAPREAPHKELRVQGALRRERPPLCTKRGSTQRTMSPGSAQERTSTTLHQERLHTKNYEYRERSGENVHHSAPREAPHGELRE